jgi:hypothetical protein
MAVGASSIEFDYRDIQVDKHEEGEIDDALKLWKKGTNDWPWRDPESNEEYRTKLLSWLPANR